MGHWHNIANVRNFLCTYAEQAGFDPLQPENWRRVTVAQVAAKVNECLTLCYLSTERVFLETQGGGSILKLGLQTALKKAFPELKFRFDGTIRLGFAALIFVNIFLPLFWCSKSS